MRFENSPEYEAEMEQTRKKWVRDASRAKANYAAAKKGWEQAGKTWMKIDTCPFAALDQHYGLEGTILVSDGKGIALVTVKRRFGTPVFYKKQPEMIYRDGCPCLVGGEEDPRDDLPKWWWKWELTDVFGNMTYASGHETGKEEVGFVATHWTFLPDPPRL